MTRIFRWFQRVAGGGALPMSAGNGSLECSSDAVSESDKLFRFVVHGVLLNLVGCGGLLGNALCVAVLSRPQMRSSINCLLAGLAAADAALLAGTPPPCTAPSPPGPRRAPGQPPPTAPLPP